MMDIQDADYVVREDALHRNRRARSYIRRVARRRALKALVAAAVLSALAGAAALVWSTCIHM